MNQVDVIFSDVFLDDTTTAQLLEQRPELLEATNPHSNNTALHWAADQGRDKLVAQLLTDRTWLMR